MKIIFNILKGTFLCSLLLLSLNARSLEEIKDEGNIIVAIYENFPPYSYIENGVEKGIDIDIAKEIAKKMGVKPLWYWTGSDENLDDDLRNIIWKGNLVHKTKADVMFRVPFDYEYIRERDVSTGELTNELVVMKSPYHAERWVIATNKEYLPEIRNLANLKAHTVGVEIDTLPDAHLTSSFAGSLRQNVKHYRNIKDAAQDLKDGKIDAVAGLKTQLEFYLDFNNNKDKYYMTNGIDYAKTQWDLGVAVRTDFRALSYEIDGFMSELFRDGTIEKIFSKYKVSYEQPLVYQE